MTRRKGGTSDDSSSKSTTSGDHFRHLGDQLAGVIFGCTDETYDECVNEEVFGLPVLHFAYVQGIKVGTPLFLFNYTRRELHGVFAAASKGEMSIRRHGWTGGTTRRTSFPAQVRVKVHKKATPLKEHQFKNAIRQNYDGGPPLFQFELDVGQVKRLCQLFHSSVPRIQLEATATSEARQMQLPAVPRLPGRTGVGNRWSSQSTCNSKKPLDLRHRGVLDTDSSCTDEDEEPVGDDKRKGREQRKTRDVRNAQTFKSPIHQQLTMRDPVGREVMVDDGFDSWMSIAQMRRPRRMLGEANGLFTPAASQHFNAMHHVKKPLPLLPNAPRNGELQELLPKDDLLTQFIQSKHKDERFSLQENGQTLLLVGGVDEDDCFSQVEILHEDRQSWKASLFIPGLRCIGSHAIGVEDSVYLLGGAAEEYQPLSTVELLKSGWKRWKSLQPMRHPRLHFAASFLRNAILVIGGGNAYRELSDCESFDCHTNSWVRAPSLMQGRYGCASCTAASALFITGGGRKSSVLSMVEMLDDRSGKWLNLPAMSTARKHHAFVCFRDELWVMGGEGDDGTYLSSTEAYDLRNQQWREMPSLMHPRAFFTAQVMDSTLHVIGGAASHTAYSFLRGEQFSCDEAVWIEGLPTGSTGKRGYHASCVIDGSHHRAD